MNVLGISEIQKIDTKDDKRELYYLLTQLRIDERAAWLHWCVQYANNKMLSVNKLIVTSTTGTAMETMRDFLTMTMQYDVEVQPCLKELERMVKSKG